MELTKIRNLSDDELGHQEKTSSEQLFRLRFQVSMGQNDGVKKLRQLRKEIAQIKTVARERELGIHGESKGAEEAKEAAPVAKVKAGEGEGSRSSRREKGAQGEESRAGRREENSESEGSQ